MRERVSERERERERERESERDNDQQELINLAKKGERERGKVKEFLC